MATTFDRVASPAAPRSHRYYVGMSVAFIVLIVAGFAQRYYARLTGVEAVTPLVHMHAAVFSAWFLLLLAQTTLVAADRRDLHRRLGLTAVALVPVLTIVTIATATDAARHGWNPAGFENGVQRFFALGVLGALSFAGFAGAALWQRRRPEVHKRLIVLASVSTLWPAVTRLPSAAGLVVVPNPPPVAAIVGCVLLFVALALSGPIYDFCTRRRVSRLEVCAGVLIVATIPMGSLVALTETWKTLSAWLMG